MSSLTIDLTPEMDERLQARANQEGVAIADLVRTVLETMLAPEDSMQTEEPRVEAARPIWEKLAAIANEVPEEEIAKLPTDLAEQHDHYMSGTPKKQ
jgi:serine/threonine protein kinase HipA of HipAB toxin-antitoxin module